MSMLYDSCKCGNPLTNKCPECSGYCKTGEAVGIMAKQMDDAGALQAQLKAAQDALDAVTAERDALKRICGEAYHYLLGVDSVRTEEGKKPLTSNFRIQALNVTETRVEVPRE